MTNDFRGLHQRPRNPTKALEPGKAYDLLTALHQSAGDGRYTVLRCQCGERVIRLSRQVARSIREVDSGGRAAGLLEVHHQA